MTEHLVVQEGMFTVRITDVPNSLSEINIIFRSEDHITETQLKAIIRVNQRSLLDLIRKHLEIIDTEFRRNYSLFITHSEKWKHKTKAYIYQHQYIYKSQCVNLDDSE